MRFGLWVASWHPSHLKSRISKRFVRRIRESRASIEGMQGKAALTAPLPGTRDWGTRDCVWGTRYVARTICGPKAARAHGCGGRRSREWRVTRGLGEGHSVAGQPPSPLALLGCFMGEWREAESCFSVRERTLGNLACRNVVCMTDDPTPRIVHISCTPLQKPRKSSVHRQKRVHCCNHMHDENVRGTRCARV